MSTVTETDLIKSYTNDYFVRLDERIKSLLEQTQLEDNNKQDT